MFLQIFELLIFLTTWKFTSIIITIFVGFITNMNLKNVYFTKEKHNMIQTCSL